MPSDQADRRPRAFSPALRIALALALGVLIPGCSGGGGTSSPAPAPVPASPDFSLTVTPSSLSIPAGGSAYLTVTVSRLNGFTGPISLNGLQLPAGVHLAGEVPASASMVQLPLVLAREVGAQALALKVEGKSGALLHEVPLALTVAAALPPGHLGTDLVQASGGHQTMGNLQNQGLANVPVVVSVAKSANGDTQVRHGFLPSGSPTDQ